MRILVTGARGFTGLHFAAAARAAGHTIVPLAAQLQDEVSVRTEVHDAAADAVVHLAAISFVGHADPRAFYNVNLFGTLHLLEALATAPCRPERVLIAGSANVYGNCEASPIPENQVPAPVNHYATSKLAMEHMARTYATRIPLVIVRPFNYTGLGQAPNFVVPKLVAHFAQRAPTVSLGNLDVEREFNDVRTVCEAYLRLLAAGKDGEVYNVCSGRPWALRSVIDTLTELTGHRISVEQNPAFMRSNELSRLYGSPDKLLRATGPLPAYSLAETLGWMLNGHTPLP